MYSFFSNLKKCRDNNELYPKVEVIIANYILDNHKIIPTISIKELAQKCNTSISTISRFCKRVNGSDFKTLKEDCRIYNNFLEEKEVIKPNIKKFSEKNYLNDIFKALQETSCLNENENIRKTIFWIKRAKKIFFFGTSFSNIFAQNISEKFMRLGKNTICPLTISSQDNIISQIHSDDLAIIISFSNNNFQINRIKNILRKKKIKIIYISSRQDVETNNEITLLVSKLSYKEFESPIIQEFSISYIINYLYLYYTEKEDI